MSARLTTAALHDPLAESSSRSSADGEGQVVCHWSACLPVRTSTDFADPNCLRQGGLDRRRGQFELFRGLRAGIIARHSHCRPRLGGCRALVNREVEGYSGRLGRSPASPPSRGPPGPGPSSGPRGGGASANFSSSSLSSLPSLLVSNSMACSRNRSGLCGGRSPGPPPGPPGPP